MRKPLDRAFAEATQLPDSEQEIFAEFLLAELRDDSEWRTLLSSSPDLLARLAEEARGDHRTGQTEPIGGLLS